MVDLKIHNLRITYLKHLVEQKPNKTNRKRRISPNNKTNSYV